MSKIPNKYLSNVDALGGFGNFSIQLKTLYGGQFPRLCLESMQCVVLIPVINTFQNQSLKITRAKKGSTHFIPTFKVRQDQKGLWKIGIISASCPPNPTAFSGKKTLSMPSTSNDSSRCLPTS